MWYATTDEEANFIFDLLAYRDTSETMLKYARWLEDRGHYREAEFLRLELSPAENVDRLMALSQELDARWLGTVLSRRFRRGDVVRITGDLFQGMEGSVVEVDSRSARAGLLLNIFYSPTELSWVAFNNLRLLKCAAEEHPQK